MITDGKGAIRGFAWMFAEKFCAQIVSLLVSIILARILLPDDYAVVGIVSIFFAFCNVLISGGLNTSLIQKKEADTKDYSTVLTASLVIAAILYMVMFLGAPLIAALYKKTILIPVIRVMGLIFFINAFKSVLYAYVSSTLQFKKFFWSTIAGTIISAGAGIIMALTGYGAWALVAQMMVNSLVDTLILFVTTQYRIKFYFSMTRFKSLFQYGWKIFVTSLITVVYDEINPLIVGIKYSSADLSFYSKGRSFPGTLGSSVNSALVSVMFPYMAKVQDDKDKVLNMTRWFLKMGTYVVFPIMIGLCSVADSFVEAVLTEKWLPCVPYMQIFCMSYMFNIVHSGNLESIKAIGRSDITLVMEIIKKSVYCLIIVLFVMFSKNPIVLAVSSLVCTMVALVINTYPNRKYIGYKYRYQIRDILPNLLLSLMMGVCVWGIGLVVKSAIIRLVMQIVVGGLVYLFLSAITKNECFIFCFTYVKRILKRN